MTYKLLTAASIVALLSAPPALAQMNANSNSNSPQSGSESAASQSSGNIGEDAKDAWGNIKDETAEIYGDVKEGTSEAYKDIKASLMDDDENPAGTNLTLNEITTANGIIGQDVHNEAERVGTVHDIILNREGEATMIIVADGELFGLGKLAAFDYSSIMRTNADGDIVAPITERDIERAADFSYDREDYSSDVRVIPTGGYSVSTLLDGQLTGNDNNVLGEIDDIHFKGGEASHLIVGFNQILGMGGEKAAIKFDNAKITPDGDEYDFKLASDKTAQFESFKRNSMN